MRHFPSDSAESYLIGVVDVARWEQFELGDTLPFQAMWYTVPPASSSPRDCHPEVELSVVISGTASVEASGEVTDVAPGSCFLLGSEEAHVIHNRSADRPLFIFTTYWMPRAGDGPVELATASAAGSGAAEEGPS
jgi:mannose-6-phosphate isomerase-like protein (cupin superfamily)